MPYSSGGLLEALVCGLSSYNLEGLLIEKIASFIIIFSHLVIIENFLISKVVSRLFFLPAMLVNCLSFLSTISRTEKENNLRWSAKNLQRTEMLLYWSFAGSTNLREWKKKTVSLGKQRNFIALFPLKILLKTLKLLYITEDGLL